LNSRHGAVFSLAATNALEAVDPALLQPGRFEEIIEMGMPDRGERREILEIALRSVRHSSDVDSRISDLAGMTDTLTASDIVGLCQKAAIRALMANRSVMEFVDLKHEIEFDIFARPRPKPQPKFP
jgi:transitional endoplasmic reticulum ATPase